MILRNRKLIGLSALGGIIATSALVFTLTRTDDVVHQTAAPHAAPSVERPKEQALSVQTAIAGVERAELRADLEKLYAENEYRPLWAQDKAGRNRLTAVDGFIQSLDAQGLDPAFLREAKTRALAARTTDERLAADVHMSAAVLRAAHGQRFGFLPGKSLGWNVAEDKTELAAFLGEAAAKKDLADYFESLKPRHPQFTALTDALTRYREIAASGGWGTIPADKEIKIADDTRLPALRARLAAEGYLAATADDAAVLEAVKLFQARNGLEPDGRIGRGTLAALNVTVTERIAQITANLERWRHMRQEEPAEYVVANVADQSVAVIRGGRETLRLRTVVGSVRHATPILEAKLTGVTLNPPWEIPTSIITKEILPKLDAEPSYLIDNGMDVVSGSWDRPSSLRMRQRPGAGNSLGHMKFQMQNQWNIYLHDTPSRSLFAKDDRYFSHGCVRVQTPEELATHLTGVSIDELNEGIASGQTRTIKLEKPLPVFVLYWTAFADSDGHFNFRRDAYGRDAQTAAALAEAGLLPRSSEVVGNGN